MEIQIIKKGWLCFIDVKCNFWEIQLHYLLWKLFSRLYRWRKETQLFTQKAWGNKAVRPGVWASRRESERSCSRECKPCPETQMGGLFQESPLEKWQGREGWFLFITWISTVARHGSLHKVNEWMNDYSIPSELFNTQSGVIQSVFAYKQMNK